jgi:hypothetical protein
VAVVEEQIFQDVIKMQLEEVEQEDIEHLFQVQDVMLDLFQYQQQLILLQLVVVEVEEIMVQEI